MDEQAGNDEAPGWASLDAALGRLYGSQEPLHYGTLVKFALGGPDPLDGISVYPRDTPVPHWHFVTYGLSELYEKESDDPSTSGYGFELTLRLRRTTGDAEPPAWAINFLQNLARYVFSSGNAFAAGHHMDLNGPIALDRETAIRAVAFTPDPELEPLATPFGRVELLEVVGLTLDELRAIKAWNTAGLLELLAGRLPLLVTDLGRASSLSDPSFAAEVARRTAAEGSSTGTLFIAAARFQVRRSPSLRRRLEIVLGVTGARELKVVLPGRLPRGRGLNLLT
ncbi:MAG: suppressor of fused domain protein, partial [Acidobacteriota bacterium]|nr:suppressor of fused domain protein [Acidobacteriota bacterium]